MRVMYIKPDEFQELPSYLSPPLFNAMFGSFTTVPAPKGNKNPESTPSWMDVAKSQDIPEPVAEAVPSYAPTTRVQQLTRNVLNSDVEVIGSLCFSDDLLIDGTVEGDISSEGVLSVYSGSGGVYSGPGGVHSPALGAFRRPERRHPGGNQHQIRHHPRQGHRQCNSHGPRGTEKHGGTRR